VSTPDGCAIRERQIHRRSEYRHTHRNTKRCLNRRLPNVAHSEKKSPNHRTDCRGPRATRGREPDRAGGGADAGGVCADLDLCHGRRRCGSDRAGGQAHRFLERDQRRVPECRLAGHAIEGADGYGGKGQLHRILQKGKGHDQEAEHFRSNAAHAAGTGEA